MNVIARFKGLIACDSVSDVYCAQRKTQLTGRMAECTLRTHLWSMLELIE